MKMVLALQHQVLPRTLHAEEPSPHVDWQAGGVRLSGQGPQWAGMGRELYAASPVFAAGFDRACGLLEAELGVPATEVVLGQDGDAESLVRMAFNSET